MAEQKETIILDFQVDSKDAVTSIENLTKANKALREERKKLDLDSVEGQQRAKEINATLDKNTDTIKNNSSALEKQRMKIGDYSGALDKLVPGLGATIEGFKGMVKGALAFIATPIGLVVAALGVAIASLTQYFKGSEEGQDKLAKVMAVGKVVMNALILVVEKLGEVLFSVGEFVGNIAGKLIDVFAPSVGKAMDEVRKQGEAMADLEDKIEADENAMIVRRAQTAKKVAKLREDSLKQEGDAKRKTIQEAIDLEKALADEETNHAKDKLRLIELDIASSGAATEEQKRARAEATADVINQESQRAEATLRFTKQIEKLKDDEAKKNEKRRADEQKKIDKYFADWKKDNDEKQKLIDGYEKKRQEYNDKQTDDTVKLALLKIQSDQEVQAQQSATIAKVLAEQEDAINKEIAAFAKKAAAVIDTTKGWVDQIFGLKETQYKLEENALAVSLAKQKTALNKQYADDLAALKKKLDAGLISEDEFKKQQLLLNSQQQADIKKAEIDQANALNDIKKKIFETDKKNRIADAVISVTQAVIKTLASLPWPFNLIPAAAMGVLGAIKIKQIEAERFVPATFRKGGYTGDGDPNQLAGMTHKKEFVMPESVVSRFGKEHFQSYMDGSIAASGATKGMGYNMQPAPIVYLSYKEFTEFSNRVKLKESIVTA